jgi:hypothetical protein
VIRVRLLVHGKADFRVIGLFRLTRQVNDTVPRLAAESKRFSEKFQELCRAGAGGEIT